MVSITTRTSGCRAVMNRVASIPSSCGHLDVHHHDVGQRLADDVQRVAAVGGGADDLDAVERAEQGDQPVADDLVVVGDDDPDRARSCASPHR